jgi:transcriptional regulator with XRE-family HTH domain
MIPTPTHPPLHRDCLARLIQLRRLELELSINELADRTGWTVEALDDLEAGRCKQLPPVDTAIRLTRALDLELGDLLTAAGMADSIQMLHPRDAFPAWLLDLDEDAGFITLTEAERHAPECIERGIGDRPLIRRCLQRDLDVADGMLDEVRAGLPWDEDNWQRRREDADLAILRHDVEDEVFAARRAERERTRREIASALDERNLGVR